MRGRTLSIMLALLLVAQAIMGCESPGRGSGRVVDCLNGTGTYARMWQSNECKSGTCCEELKNGQ